MYILTGLSVQQSKSDSSRNGIIMNGANETVDSGNAAASVDASIDKSAVQQKSVDDVNPPINGGIQHVQIEPSKPKPIAVAMKRKLREIILRMITIYACFFSSSYFPFYFNCLSLKPMAVTANFDFKLKSIRSSV